MLTGGGMWQAEVGVLGRRKRGVGLPLGVRGAGVFTSCRFKSCPVSIF